jgi:hypothetical protein
MKSKKETAWMGVGLTFGFLSNQKVGILVAFYTVLLMIWCFAGTEMNTGMVIYY